MIQRGGWDVFFMYRLQAPHSRRVDFLPASSFFLAAERCTCVRSHMGCDDSSGRESLCLHTASFHTAASLPRHRATRDILPRSWSVRTIPPPSDRTFRVVPRAVARHVVCACFLCLVPRRSCPIFCVISMLYSTASAPFQPPSFAFMCSKPAYTLHAPLTELP